MSASDKNTSQLQTIAERYLSFVAVSQGSSTKFGNGGLMKEVVIAATTIGSPALCPAFSSTPRAAFGIAALRVEQYCTNKRSL
jgi:hypothetical protein